MNTRKIGLHFFLLLVFMLTWLSLWMISFYLAQHALLAVLFLPAGLTLAFLILLPRHYWLSLILAATAVLLLIQTENLYRSFSILLSPLFSLISALIARRYWHRYHLYWQRLSLLLAMICLNSLLQSLLSLTLPFSLSEIMLSTLTGSVLVIPFIYLIYEYFRQENARRLIYQKSVEPPLKTSLLIWGALFFSMGVSIQLVYSPEMSSLLFLVIFLPNVFMAYRFGWQGGVFAALLGSILLTITRHASGAFQQVNELQLFLVTQALLGIGLGIAVSRQQQLVHHLTRYRKQLEKELKMRRELTEQLVHTEESIRKDIARELHDEIGQNITAIQIQSMLVRRTTPSEAAQLAASEITRLSDKIHQTTRQLLRKLRPLVLDEMSLHEALSHLIQEFHFEQQGVKIDFVYLLPDERQDETLIFTLYRLVQELLNNVNKHAQAKQVRLSLSIKGEWVILEVTDNGVGMINKPHRGLGLKGIDERVTALGGTWSIKNHQGTQVTIHLPIKLST